MRFLPIAAVVLMTLSLAACGGDDNTDTSSPESTIRGSSPVPTVGSQEDWEEARKRLIAGCEDKGAPYSYCKCTWDNLKERYTLNEITKLDVDDPEVYSVIRTIAAICNAEYQP